MIRNIIIGIVSILIIIFTLYFIYRLFRDYNSFHNNEPWIVRGTKTARSPKVIPGELIKESTDSQYGIEFTYVMWLYVNDWTTFKSSEYKHVMHKGDQSGMPLQAPGIWLYPNENKLAINMNTFKSIKETCDIGNIPVSKWFHLTIMVIGNNMDVYVNGKLKKRCQYDGIPRQNFGDLYISQFGGFDGFMSNMRYYNYALSYPKLEQIVNDGPSKDNCIDTGAKPPYLSDRYWFQTGFPDSVNTINQ